MVGHLPLHPRERHLFLKSIPYTSLGQYEPKLPSLSKAIYNLMLNNLANNGN
jgi:hypothetical protein